MVVLPFVPVIPDLQRPARVIVERVGQHRQRQTCLVDHDPGNASRTLGGPVRDNRRGSPQRRLFGKAHAVGALPLQRDEHLSR